MNELLDAAKPGIIESLKNELTRSITYDVKQAAMEEVKKTVVAWVTAEIIPDVVKSLVEYREGLISIGPKVGAAIVDEISKSMILTASENLKQSWNRKVIFEKLFN